MLQKTQTRSNCIKNSVRLQVFAKAKGAILEVIVKQNTEVVFKEDEGDYSYDDFDFWSPN
jgi:hypothetical protein